jgi:cell shape-determining protein MreC
MLSYSFFQEWHHLKRYLKRVSFFNLIITMIVLGAGMIFFIRSPLKNSVEAFIFEKSILVYGWISRPKETFYNIKDTFYYHLQAHHNQGYYQDLTTENKRLQQELLHLTQENALLRTITQFVGEPERRFFTLPTSGYVVNENHHVLYLKAGRHSHLFLNQPVFSQGMIVGLIDKLSNEGARVRLITDQESRVPVYFAKSGCEAILTGNGDGQLEISVRQSALPIQPGDAVYTSGMDGHFPPHHYVGQVIKVEDENAVIDPDFQPQGLFHIQVASPQKGGPPRP